MVFFTGEEEGGAGVHISTVERKALCISSSENTLPGKAK